MVDIPQLVPSVENFPVEEVVVRLIVISSEAINGLPSGLSRPITIGWDASSRFITCGFDLNTSLSPTTLKALDVPVFPVMGSLTVIVTFSPGFVIVISPVKLPFTNGPRDVGRIEPTPREQLTSTFPAKEVNVAPSSSCAVIVISKGTPFDWFPMVEIKK